MGYIILHYTTLHADTHTHTHRQKKTHAHRDTHIQSQTNVGMCVSKIRPQGPVDGQMAS